MRGLLRCLTLHLAITKRSMIPLQYEWYSYNTPPQNNKASWFLNDLTFGFMQSSCWLFTLWKNPEAISVGWVFAHFLKIGTGRYSFDTWSSHLETQVRRGRAVTDVIFQTVPRFVRSKFILCLFKWMQSGGCVTIRYSWMRFVVWPHVMNPCKHSIWCQPARVLIDPSVEPTTPWTFQAFPVKSMHLTLVPPKTSLETNSSSWRPTDLSSAILSLRSPIYWAVPDTPLRCSLLVVIAAHLALSLLEGN